MRSAQFGNAVQLEVVNNQEVARRKGCGLIADLELSRAANGNDQLEILVPMHPLWPDHPAVMGKGVLLQQQGKRWIKSSRQVPARVDERRNLNRLTRLFCEERKQWIGEG